MAVYKVIQDIEAEDKLLGPLTLRQFIYAGGAVMFYYLTFLALTKGAAFMAIFFMPIGLIGTFFAWPWSRDQPTEVWALAKIRFLVKPRKRIWNQSGVKELVTITAPRKIQTVYTNGLTQSEVESRLRALAETIDSRGWAIKNVNVNMYQQPAVANVMTSDRLIDMATMPQEVPDLDIQANDDVMEASNPIARQFDSMIAASTKAHRQEILENLRSMDDAPAQAQKQPGNDYWFLNQPGAPGTAVPQDAVTFNTQVVTPNTTGVQEAGEVNATSIPSATSAQGGQSDDPALDEAALIQKLHEQDKMQSANPYNRWHTIQPLSQQQVAGQPPMQPQPQNSLLTPQQVQTQPVYQTGQMPATVSPVQPAYPTQSPAAATSNTLAPQPPQQQVTPTSDPAILQLASNDDLNVATIAREANKRKGELQDEVVISLH